MVDTSRRSDMEATPGGTNYFEQDEEGVGTSEGLRPVGQAI